MVAVAVIGLVVVRPHLEASTGIVRARTSAAGLSSWSRATANGNTELTGKTKTASTAPLRRRRRKAATPTVSPLPPPANLASLVSPAPAGDGIWHAAGRLVVGLPAVYETTLHLANRPGVVAGVAFLDTALLKATLYSGSASPGGLAWKDTAPISPAAAATLVAAFNGGFKFPDADGGYYAEGKLVYPFRAGAASLVIYANGSVALGQWGRDVSMSSTVVAVRQNLNLIVDNGHPVAGLSPYDHNIWGSTVGGIPNVWRSGLGITADGALIYAAGPSLTVVDLAGLLAHAGAVRAMQLDINPYWPTFATYKPASATGVASPANGTDLLGGMTGTPARFFTASWGRDFVTMSAALP